MIYFPHIDVTVSSFNNRDLPIWKELVLNYMMRKFCFSFFLIINLVSIFAQRGFNYYNDSSHVGSPNAKSYTYFRKGYYDCIWKWTTAGADSAEYYLKLAIHEDSNYSAAYAFLVHVCQFKTYNLSSLSVSGNNDCTSSGTNCTGSNFYCVTFVPCE